MPLNAIFVVDQAVQERTKRVGISEAICLLTEVARQAARQLWRTADPTVLSVFHRERFDNLCALVQVVPVYLLDVSLKGSFWREMERVIDVP